MQLFIGINFRGIEAVRNLIYLTIFFCHFLPNNSFSLDIDSLKRVVASQEISRKKADDVYTIMRIYFMSQSYDSAHLYADKLFAIASEMDYKERMADAIYIRSKALEAQGRLNEALTSLTPYFEIVNSMDDKVRMAKGYFIYSRLISIQGQKELATQYLKNNISLGKELSDTMMLLASMNELGNIYQDLNIMDSAVRYYLECAKLCNNASREKHLGPIYNNLGKSFTRLKNYSEGEKYLKTSLELNRKMGDSTTVFTNLLNLGFIHLYRGDDDSALIYFDWASNVLSASSLESLYKADIYNAYAEVYEKEGKYPEALEYLKKAYNIYQGENYVEGIAVSLVNMGSIYTRLKRFDMAEQVIDSSYRVARNSGSKINQKAALWALAENSYQRGNYKAAYDQFVRYHNLYDTILESKRSDKINELNILFNKEKVEKENLALKNRNLEMELDLRQKTNQSNLFLFTGIGLVLIAIIIALYFRQRSIISKNKILQLEEEQKLLRAKLLLEGQEQERKRIAQELHDGLGVLLSATKMQFSSIRLNRPEDNELLNRAMQLLEQASGDVRKISHNMMPGLLTKMGLYEAVEDLLENIKDAGNIKTQIEIPPDLKRPRENTEIMLYRIIQELVHNTLKHSGARNIRVSMNVSEGDLLIHYEDDGVGFDVEKLLASKEEGLGIKSVQSRVDFLNGTLKIDSAPGQGVRYTLSVPMK